MSPLSRLPRTLLLVAALALPSPLAALSLEEARALLYRGDPDALETAFSDLRKAVDAGDLTQDDQRAAYSAFATTDPRVEQATRAWREAFPGSIYPRMGAAWTDFHVGWILRGGKFAHETHPDALEDFHRRMLAVRETAWDIYRTDPDFVPASDALFRVAPALGGQVDPDARGGVPNFGLGGLVRHLLTPDPVERLLDEVMERTPNYGSLHRALAITAPNWRGSFDDLQRLCLRHAPRAAEHAPVTTDICILDGGLAFQHDLERLHPYAARVGSFDGPILETWRLHDAVLLRPTAPGAADTARALVEAPDFTNVLLASHYDSVIAARKRWPEMYLEVLRRRGALAEQALEVDPYNPELVDFVVRARRSVETGMPQPIELHLARARMTVSPFDGEGWIELGAAEVPEDDVAARPLERYPYLRNAAYYSRYDPLAMRMLVTYLDQHHDGWDQIHGPEATIAAQSDSRLATQLAALRDTPLGRMQETTLLCPFAAAFRLYDATCAGGNAQRWECDMHPPQRAALEARYRDAERRALCPVETGGALEDILLTPAPVEIWRTADTSQ